MYDASRRWRAALPPWQPRSLSTLLVAMVILFNMTVADLTQQYCSSENTADTDSSDSTFQSLGLCKTTCQGSYALAVVQGASCWCSNYLPADTTSVGSCSKACQGYPYENCGDSDKGLYGYMVLDQAAISGTIGASSSTAASSTTSSESSQTTLARESPSSSAQAQTVYDTVTDDHTFTPSPSVIHVTDTHSVSQTSSTQAVKSTSASQTTFGSVTSRTSSPTWTPSPVTTVQILTISNTPVTQTVTSMPTVTSGSETATTSKTQSKGVSGGLIAGIVIGTVAGMLLIGAIFFWCWRKRRQNQQVEAEAGTAIPGSSNRPTRNVSVLSKQGLLEKVYPSAAMVQRSHTTSQSPSFNMSGNDGSSVVSPISERRNSRPLFYDQRLNPTALMDIDNVSRISVNTLPDNRDFSRTLNVTNPDPDGWD